MLFQLENATSIANNIKQQIHGFSTFLDSIKFIAQLRISFIEWVFLGLEQAGQNSVVKSEAPYFFEFFL